MDAQGQKAPRKGIGAFFKKGFTPALLALAVISVFVLVMKAKVRDTRSDSFGTLLVSQSVLEHGTIKLNSYYHYINSLPKQHSIELVGGGYFYNIYPLGTPVFSIPFVWAANLMGKDMLYDEGPTQILIAAVLCSAVFALLYGVAKCYVSRTAGLTIVSVSFLGSALISCMGTALWSIDFAVFFEVLALFLIVLRETGRRGLNPYVLGFLLFAAYFCRPTAVVFMAVACAFILIRHRGLFVRTASTIAVLFLLFAAFSVHEFGVPLPPYYSYGSSLSLKTFWRALYGLLLSPSRGILIFSPFFALLLPAVPYFFRRLMREGMFWFGLAGFLINLLLVATWTGWWGGWSFGPRLLTEAVPLLTLISVLLWRELRSGKRLLIYGAAGLYLLLGAAGVFVNTWQGLYNPLVPMWNAQPNIDENTDLLFDWKYPQFLVSEEMIRRRVAEYRHRD